VTIRRYAILPRQRFDRALGGWICRNCGKVVPKGKKSWCNMACKQEAGIKAWPAMARRLVSQRDKGICARCGFDAEALDEAVKSLCPWGGWVQGDYRGLLSTYRAFLRENGLRLERSHWEAHHKHAVAEGGGGCGSDNYETLCWRCHPQETGQLRQRLNRAKIRMPLFEETRQ